MFPTACFRTASTQIDPPGPEPLHVLAALRTRVSSLDRDRGGLHRDPPGADRDLTRVNHLTLKGASLEHQLPGKPPAIAREAKGAKVLNDGGRLPLVVKNEDLVCRHEGPWPGSFPYAVCVAVGAAAWEAKADREGSTLVKRPDGSGAEVIDDRPAPAGVNDPDKTLLKRRPGGRDEYSRAILSACKAPPAIVPVKGL
ncbi:MAG: hypothetical protein ETSY2_38230 [Candidatus Entotheonella gemina]|uniref:Uncharacterized protein n=1 Tax=Candidatus Entotheonella gemina TaxID=1429439 RepID=W4LS82_9BACT|nr:MAG: hypothetical protein ETSY2_38230 [Candidatus Entotheonella gemina]